MLTHPPLVLSLAWVSSVTAGHTKKITVNAIMLCAYCIGNASAPFMWQEKYKPRYVPRSSAPLLTQLICTLSNRIPWIIIAICYALCAVILLVLRYVLARENKRRDAEPADHTYDDVWIERPNSKGEVEKVKVEKVCFVLTSPRWFVDCFLGIPGSHRYSESRFPIRVIELDLSL